jgi:hypothetical protein
MAAFLRLCVILGAVAFQVSQATASPNQKNYQIELQGAGTFYMERPFQETCIPPQTKTLVQQSIQAFTQPPTISSQNIGSLPSIDSVALPLLYPFYPQGGTLYRDITTGNFVDLNPAAGVVGNYLCETYGNDGHQGMDSGGLTWEEMTIGQPVYAALNGTVISVQDGDPDMNTSCQAGGNWVIINHGAGREAWYFHLKKNSITVTIGQFVRAGQQIGSVGSSGCSFGPHLHFQSMQNGQVYEPFKGACRSGKSGWLKQTNPPPSGAFVRDMGVTTQDIGLAPPLPSRAPVNNQIPLAAGGNIYYWIQFGNLPANSSWVERYVRPNGTTEYQLGPFPFGNPSTYQFSQYWFPRLVGGMASTTGTWRIQFEVNGVLLVDAPVEVVSTVSGTFNRPPEGISAVFDPATPRHGQALFARVSAPAVGTGYRDRDWDIVRYRYRWKVNGATVRNIISAGMADALSSQYLVSGNNVEVTITAGDGFGGTALGTSAPPVVLSAIIP